MAHRGKQQGDLEWEGTCHRCGKKSTTHIMSMFCRELICLTCSLKERRHPSYETAQDADNEAYRKGVRDFPGIGLPVDLRVNPDDE